MCIPQLDQIFNIFHLYTFSFLPFFILSSPASSYPDLFFFFFLPFSFQSLFFSFSISFFPYSSLRFLFFPHIFFFSIFFLISLFLRAFLLFFHPSFFQPRRFESSSATPNPLLHFSLLFFYFHTVFCQFSRSLIRLFALHFPAFHQ